MENILQIPQITNTTLQYFVDGDFLGWVTADEVNKIRENVLEYIVKTKDASILDRFYFIGHEDSNDKMGKETRITMDNFGNLSELPWEMAHVRRSTYHLMQIVCNNYDLLDNFNND